MTVFAAHRRDAEADARAPVGVERVDLQAADRQLNANILSTRKPGELLNQDSQANWS